MSDLDRRLRDALRAVGDAYEPSDEAAARARFLRRRRRRRMAWAGGSALVAAAAVAAALLFLPARTVPEEDSPPVEAALRPVVAATIAVGEEPSGLVYGGGAVWVAAGGDDAVWRIDPGTDETTRIEVAPGPDDVIAAGGDIWVVHPGRDLVTRIDARRAEVVEEIAIPAGGAHLDLARSDGSLWLLAEGGALLRYDLVAGAFDDPVHLPDDATDIAALGGDLWVYYRDAGEVRPIDGSTGEATGAPALVGGADDADLAAGLGAVWFYGDGDGALVRIDARDGTVDDEVPLGGAYAGLAVGDRQVWAVVGDGGGRGALYQIDAATMRPLGGEVPLGGRPLDVAVGSRSVWVSNADAGTVTRVDLVRAPVEEVAATEETPAPVPYEEVVLYASDGKDVVALLGDGTRRRVAATAAPEVAPAVSPDGRRLVFQRGAATGAEPAVLIAADVATGGTEEVGRGTAPAFGPDGRLAWLEPEPDGGLLLHLGEGGPPAVVYRGGGLAEASSLSWSPAGERVALEAGPASARRSYVNDAVPADPGVGQAVMIGSSQDWTQVGSDEIYADAALRAPLPQGDSVYVLRTCCLTDDPDFETLDLGRVDAGGEFTRIKGLDDVGLDPNAARFWLAPAGGLDYEADDGWRLHDDLAWLVSDGATAVLVDERGEVDVVPVDGAYGIAANPLALAR